MREISFQNTYIQDFKLVKKQGWDLAKIKSAISELQNSDILDKKLRDHALVGDLKGYRECHVYGDLIIIYKRNKDSLILYRIGRHQDLFKGY